MEIQHGDFYWRNSMLTYLNHNVSQSEYPPGRPPHIYRQNSSSISTTIYSLLMYIMILEDSRQNHRKGSNLMNNPQYTIHNNTIIATWLRAFTKKALPFFWQLFTWNNHWSGFYLLLQWHGLQNGYDFSKVPVTRITEWLRFQQSTRQKRIITIKIIRFLQSMVRNFK